MTEPGELAGQPGTTVPYVMVGQPRTIRPWSPPRTPAFWLVLAVLAVCSLAGLLFTAYVVWPVPRSALVSIPLLTGYAVGLLLLLRYVDHLARRPWWLVAMAFCWGGTAAVAVGAGSGYFLGLTWGAIAAGVSGYVWLASLLVVLLFSDGF